MQVFDPANLHDLYVPAESSHKGQNGKLLLIGGSHLFHAASLWALKIASRIVDMVFYSSVPENNHLVQMAKYEFRDGIIVPRDHIEDYIAEAECILLGPGMVRGEKPKSHHDRPVEEVAEILHMQDEGEQTYHLTQFLLRKYHYKRWVIDAGALQMMELSSLKKLSGDVIITPHKREFTGLFDREPSEAEASYLAKEYNCVILLKGKEDIVASPTETVTISGGNAGMTKGGTGDVLAGLVAALACKNDLFLAATAGSFFNKKAGDALYERVGYYFNASDLVDEIPRVMRQLLPRNG
jgi:ADP-dependent NAD(P)H-hydrate dehydratase / NAD(P)H-hydrate epimerase